MVKTELVATGKSRRVARRLSCRLALWLGCAVLLGVAGCAIVPEQVARKKEGPLVYPDPPEVARFVYEQTIRSNLDVINANKDRSVLRELLTGEGDEVGRHDMIKPYAIAVHRGRIFVSDTRMGDIKVFDVPARQFFTIGGMKPGKLGKPIGIDVDAEGNLYVADAGFQVIMVYDREGNYLRKLGAVAKGEPPLFSRLTSVTVDKKGEKIYAVDIGRVDASETHRVRVFDARSGVHLFDIGKRGSASGEFNFPRDMAIGKDGNLYVVDGGNFRIQVFDPEGKYLRNFGALGNQFGSFTRPKEVASDADGNIYVIDSNLGNFQIFDAEGHLLLFIGTPSNEDGPGLYALLSGVTVDEDGRVYVVDQLFRKVDIFRPAALAAEGGYLGKKPLAGEKPASAATVRPTAPDKTTKEDGLE